MSFHNDERQTSKICQILVKKTTHSASSMATRSNTSTQQHQTSICHLKRHQSIGSVIVSSGPSLLSLLLMMALATSIDTGPAKSHMHTNIHANMQSKLLPHRHPKTHEHSVQRLTLVKPAIRMHAASLKWMYAKRQAPLCSKRHAPVRRHPVRDPNKHWSADVPRYATRTGLHAL